MIQIASPTKAYISNELAEKLKTELTYTDKKVVFELNRVKHNKWLKNSKPIEWAAEVSRLQALVKSTLIFKDSDGYYIRSGSIPYLLETGLIDNEEIVNKIIYPKPKLYPWYKKIPFELYPYQSISVEKLLAEKHGSVELCTGSGKSAIIMKLAQQLGLNTIVTVPSQSIFYEMVEKFEEHFGKGAVGCIGDGKKKLGKKFTICIADSLVTMKKDSDAYKQVKAAQVLITDESHGTSCETLDEVCHNALADIPYRFFLSGTQTRADGTQKVLESIIGRNVHTLKTDEAIRGGYVCDHEFRIVKTTSTYTGAYSSDPLVNKRNHFLRNENIRDFTAKLATVSWKAKKQQTLILVDELSQIVSLVPKIDVPFSVATSASSKTSILSAVIGVSEKVLKDNFDAYFEQITPEQKNLFNLIKDSEPSDAVESFNRGETHVLIGTSCISTGTNIFPTHNTVNWQGGSSETKTKQGAVGRSVRLLEKSKYKDLHEPKPKTIIWDFDVEGVEALRVQLIQRLRYYKDSGVEIRSIG